jgi:hypothetical protein
MSILILFLIKIYDFFPVNTEITNCQSVTTSSGEVQTISGKPGVEEIPAGPCNLEHMLILILLEELMK